MLLSYIHVLYYIDSSWSLTQTEFSETVAPSTIFFGFNACLFLHALEVASVCISTHLVSLKGRVHRSTLNIWPPRDFVADWNPKTIMSLKLITMLGLGGQPQWCSQKQRDLGKTVNLSGACQKPNSNFVKPVFWTYQCFFWKDTKHLVGNACRMWLRQHLPQGQSGGCLAYHADAWIQF